MIEISLARLADPDERRHLLRLPTSLSLPAEDIDRVRAAARRLLLDSLDLRRLVVRTPTGSGRMRAAFGE